MVTVHFEDWGLISYGLALEKQKDIQSQLVQFKLENRETEKSGIPPHQYLIFCEHPPVYTLGNRAHSQNLLISTDELQARNIEIYPIRRGGDITFHGPGQMVGYPILDLEMFFTDIHKYLRYIEEGIILTLKEFDIPSGRIEGLSGVWIDPENPLRARKICAVGVHCSRWITMHGFALNINTDLGYFKHIIPCGIKDKGISSMAIEKKQWIDPEKVKSLLREKLASLFQMDLQMENPFGH
jgi:lipoyl(octanoyl) transferase